MCIPSLIIIFIAYFINGADYFVGGVAALVTGPIMYFIFKRKYGRLNEDRPGELPRELENRAGYRRYEKNGVDVCRFNGHRVHRCVLPAVV